MASGCGRRLALAVGVAACLGSIAGALELRSYSPERHDRFTGYPAAPAFNDSAYYGSRKFSGIGWIPGETNSRQFALVSPQHLVFALHFAPAPGTVIRFLNANGVTVDRTISDVQTLSNSSSQPVDLCLVRLSTPITEADAVAHFPYLNLSGESTYNGTALTIFGWEAKAGRGSITAIEDSDITGINTTRVIKFRYSKTGGNQDDARVVTGDSGSPSFGMAGGNPAILGIHTAAGETLTQYLGYDSFVPHYVTGLNALMAPDGYRMTPAYAPSVTLSAALVVPSPLKQAYPGSCRIDLTNAGTTDAGNARVMIHFPEGTGPDSITAPGWIAETAGPQDWVFRRANLTAGTTSEFTATWSAMPATSPIPVEVSRKADGSPQAVQTFELTPAPTFAAWAEGLADESQAGDPDNDALPNIVEYAFGGDPESGVLSSGATPVFLPTISIADGRAIVRFPVRDDATARGLTYTPEFSGNLETWSALDTPVLEDATAAFVPPVSGFLLRTISWDASDPRRFLRVRVAVAE